MKKYIIAFISVITLYFALRFFNKNLHLWLVCIPILILTGVLSILILKRENFLKRFFHILSINISVFSLIIISLLLCDYYGIFFSRFNYITAKRDIIKGKITIITNGDWLQDESFNLAAKKFGFKYVSNGCFKENGIKYYNNQMFDYIRKNNGDDWEDRYDKLVSKIYRIKHDSTLSNNQKDSLVKIIIK